jgi:PAS domain S-box-containing protein
MNATVKALYVEDNPMDADRLRHYFASAAPEFDVHIVGSGEACIASVQNNPYDILLLDCNLPDIDGLEVLDALRRQGCGIPIVMLTGRGDEELVVQALRAGVSDYIAKSGDYLVAVPRILRRVLGEFRKEQRQGLPYPGGVKQILHIEHNAMDADLTLRALKRNAPNLIVRVVETCEQAFPILTGTTIDLVLVDLRMPDMDGLEFLQELKRRDILVPVVIATGGGDESTAIASLRLGAYDYVVKRGDYLNHLLYTIENAIVRFRLDHANTRLHAELENANALLEAKVEERTRQLKEKSDELNDYFSSTRDLFCIADADGAFLRLNKEWEDTLGYASDELAGRRFLDLVHPDDLNSTPQGISAAGPQQEVLNFTNRYHCKDGSYRWIEWRSTPAGKFFYAAGRDITERKRAEAERDALQKQLHQSQKMDAIGQLAGGVAHDFNNLLTGILGNVAIVRGDLPASDPLVANLVAVETAARQAADLAKGLLTFSRRAVVAAVPLDMGEAIDTTLGILKQSLPATMEIVHDVEQPAWSVLADRSQIAQVILNLAVNARDAMQGKGTLTIRTRNEVLGPEYVQDHPLARIGEFVHLSISDTGPGIPEEIREHLFEPFRTTKPAGSGTGLGLSIVYGAVKQAAGWVTADSPTGGETVFDIFLPRCLDDPTASGVPPVQVSVQVCSGTVLVVEDEPVVSAVAQSLLTRSGCTILTAGDGESALRALQEHQGTIDLILLDMTMPGMTTQEIIPALRALSASVPILLTSGYTSSDIVKQMLEEGTVQGFLAKPYEVHELLDSVQKLLHRE